MENINEKAAYELAAARVKELKKFYISLAFFFMVSAFLIIWHYNVTGDFKLNLGRSFIIIIWALILGIKGIKIFFFNSDWEKDMMRRELKKRETDKF